MQSKVTTFLNSRPSLNALYNSCPPLQPKLIYAGSLMRKGIIGAGALLLCGYAYDQRDQVRFARAQRAYLEDQEHLKEGVFPAAKSDLELLEFAEKCPKGELPHPKKGAYTPSTSQTLVVQGFTGGNWAWLLNRKKHKKIVEACGIVLQWRCDDIKAVGTKYTSDRDLICTALNLPEDTLKQRAGQLGKNVEEYKSMLNERLQHAQQGVDVSLALHADIQHRLDIHRRIAPQYPYASSALEKLLQIDPVALSKITNIPQEDCVRILEAGIGSAMYGIGLITGQTVAGLSGQVIDSSHLSTILDAAETLGKHAIRLVQLAESLQDESLSPEKRNKITQDIKEAYEKNKKYMGDTERDLIVHSIKDGELSQAFAHTLAWWQGPEDLHCNAVTAMEWGAVAPLREEDIYSLYSMSPHCLTGSWDKELRVPGLIERAIRTQCMGEQSWFVEGGFGLSPAYSDALEQREEALRMSCYGANW